jgi:sterol desaturase/sphingolipid hydroxylase (fatty acid hydroxylase superfamily)
VTPVVVPLLFAAGVVAWSFGEYALHRFAFHVPRGRWKGSHEHLRHHAGIDHQPGTTALSWAGIWTVGATVFGPIGWLVAGIAGGVALGLGWVVGFYLYEYLHWSEHRAGPGGRYGRWARRHHLHHHFGAPLKNHGVTTPFWDVVFGTYERPAQVRVPARLAAISVPWMLDDEGRVRPEYADDYQIVGRRERDERRLLLDREEAFANLVPTA